MIDIQGRCDPRFSALQARFAASLAEGHELGARFTLTLDGEVVADLWGGFADRARTRPWTADTLVPVFSTGKAAMALVVALAVERGRLRYDRPVAEVWPEFGQAGKDRVTLAQLLSHQAGLPGFTEPQDPTIWFDREAVVRKLAAQAPMWPLGAGSGYHPVTVGYLVDEVFRRADGRSIGQSLREDFAEPFGLDLWVGLPDSEHGRCVEMQKPPGQPDLGVIDSVKRSAFLDRGSAPGGRGSADWRRMEIPAANAHADGLALARLLSLVANGGRLDNKAVLSRPIMAELTRERVRGPDRVLPFTLAWTAGLMRNQGLFPWGPGELALGHAGWGGSCAFADPESRVSGCYVMNRQSVHLVGDPRPRALIEAAYAGL